MDHHGPFPPSKRGNTGVYNSVTKNGSQLIVSVKSTSGGLACLKMATKANGRMAQCEKDGHGVGFRGSERAPGGKMLRTAPWQDMGMCAGDLYAARMRVESKHVTAALGPIWE